MRRLLVGSLVILLSGVPSLAFAQQAYVITTEDAPLFVLKDAERTPLRVAKQGSRLKVVSEETDWLLVEFEDPQLGRRQGYVQRRLVQLEASVPIDVSVREGSGATPIADAAARAASGAAAAPERRGMPGGLKWTGIGLLIGSGATFGIGAAIQDGECYDYDYTCDELRTGFYVFGAILAGTGLTLLAIGAAKSGPPRTSVTLDRGRVTLRHRVPL